MSKKYPGLNSLLADDRRAQTFFNSLPEYVRESISQRADSVNSFESLKDYAENLLRGEG